MTRVAPTLILAIVFHTGCVMAGDRHESPAVSDASSTPPSQVQPTPGPHSEHPLPSLAATPVPNLQEGVTSEQGAFVGSWSSSPPDPPINTLHVWVLHIETADGAPVEGALVTVNGDMPAHGHGMPTQPEVTADLGGGDYRVEGMSFQMGGYWVIDVTVTAGDRTDQIHFGLDL